MANLDISRTGSSVKINRNGSIRNQVLPRNVSVKIVSGAAVPTVKARASGGFELTCVVSEVTTINGVAFAGNAAALVAALADTVFNPAAAV